MRIRLSRILPTRITFLAVILVVQKFLPFLVEFEKSVSRLRNVILVSTRMLVFSLGCEKSDSRLNEKCVFSSYIFFVMLKKVNCIDPNLQI